MIDEATNPFSTPPLSESATTTLIRAALVGLAAFIATACGEAAEVQAEDNVAAAPIEVETRAATVVERSRVLDLSGTLQPNRQASLSPEVSGHVSRVLVERGATVEEGDPLVVLDPGDFRLAATAASARAEAQLRGIGLEEVPDDLDELDATATVTAARADWNSARDRMERTRPLAASGVVDAQTWEQVQETATAAQARYESARQQVRSTVASYRALRADASVQRRTAASATLRAPFAGAVMSRSVEVGEFVGPQSPIVELVDASTLRLELDVPERYSEDVRVGQTLRVEVDGTDKVVTGTVRFVAAALDMERRTLTVEAVIENGEGQLRAGHFGRARLELEGTQRFVEVPTDSLVQRAGVYRLYVVKDGHASARIVELVDQDEDVSRVEGEIEEGDAIIIVPGRDIADGTEVSASAASEGN